MRRLRVRMYRQGLGDCFLLTCEDGDEARHILIDCGVLKGTPDAQERMRTVAANVRDTSGGRLDVVVVTHEHWDHLSGFLQAESIFKTLEVDEVWLAWTEDPDDDLAAELRARKQNRLQGLRAATVVAEAGTTPAAARTARVLDALLGFHCDLDAAARPTTATALNLVKRSGARIRYLRPGDTLLDHRALPGVRTYVLGPPHDRRLIKRSDPSKRHSEVYELAGGTAMHAGFLAASEALAAGEMPDAQPFDPFFRIEEAGAPGANGLFKSYYNAQGSWRRVDDDWLGYAGQLALQLDSDTNNTSLVLALELESVGKVLLFPGDAQVGNWLSWESLEWQVEDGASTRKVRSEDLLARTVLYKVGHHGSHNATLREQGLELMQSGELAAMIPVHRPTAAKLGWLMPFPALLRRLQEKTKGRIIDAETGVDDATPHGATTVAWARFVTNTNVEPGWVDYTLEW